MTTNEGMPTVDGGETVWCEGCRKLKKEVTKLQEEHAINYQTLKQKIISTDLLIRKYRTKCEEYDLQNKHMEEQSRRLERTQLDCEMLETQLKASLQSTEPLRKAQVDLEAKLKVRDTEIQNLKNSLEGAEMIQKQYEALIADNNLYANEEERKQVDKKIQNLESSNQRYANNLKSTKEELKTVKSEISRSSKNYKLLETKHKRILIRLDKYWNLLKENDLLPAGDRRPPRTNYNSGSEDQDESDFHSDDMEDENKNYSAPSPAHDLDLDFDNDLKDVESEEVSTTMKQQELKKKIIDIKKQPEPKVKPKKKGKNSKKTKVASSENTEDTEEITADEHIRENDLGDVAVTAHKHKKDDNISIRRGSQCEEDEIEKSDLESCSDFGDDFVNVGLSAMKYFFTFSPISAPVSPLPPSPAPGRVVRSSANRPSNLDDTDDSMDKMAASLQSRLHDNASRSLRRSPRLKEKTDSSIFSSEDEQESSSKRTPTMKGCKKPDIQPSPKLQNKLNFTGEGDREQDKVEDEISVASGSIAVVPTDDQELKEDEKTDGKVRGTFDRKGSLPFVVQHLFKEVGGNDGNAESAGGQNESEMENGADIDMESDTSVDTVTANNDISNHSPKKSKSFSPKPCDSKVKDLTSEASPSRMTRSMSQPESALTEPKVQSPRPKSAMARQTFLTPPPPRTKRLRAVSPKVGEEEGKETRRKRTISLPSDLSDLEPMRRSPRLRTMEKEDSSPLKETSRSSSEENLKGKVEKLDDTKKQEKIFDTSTVTSPVRILRSRSIEPTTQSPKGSDNDNDKTISPKSPTSKIRKSVPSDQEKVESLKFVPNEQDAFLDKTTKANLPKRVADCFTNIPEIVSAKPEQPMRRTRSRPILSSADSSESDIFVEKEKSPKFKIQSPRVRKSVESASKSDIVTCSVSECKNIRSKRLIDDAALLSSDSELNSNSTLTLRSKKTPMKRKQTLPKSQSSSDSESSDASDLTSTRKGCSKTKSPRKPIISSSESDNEVSGTNVVSSCHPCSSETEEEKTKSLPRTRARSSTSLVQSSDSEKQEMLQSQKRKPEPSVRRIVRKKNNESVKPDGPKEFKSKEFISTESDSDDEDEHILDKNQNNNVEQKHQNSEPENSWQTGDGPRALPTYERSRVPRGRGKKPGRGRQAIPPGKLHPLKASTYPSLKDSFRKVETIQDGKVSRATDDDHLSKESDEATSQNLFETKTKNSNSTDQVDTGIKTLKATKETESESDRSSGPGFFPLNNKRARQLRHRYKPIVSDKDFADIILERRRITRSVSDGSSSEAKKSEVEEKDKINDRNVNISKRTEKFVERLKHSAERIKSENLLVKENKKVFSTVPKRTIIAPTRKNLRGHVSSSSEVEVMNLETSENKQTQPEMNVKEMSQSDLVKNKNVLDEVDSDIVKSDIPDNENADMLQDVSLKTDKRVLSPSKKVDSDKPSSDVTEDKCLTRVKEKAAGKPHCSPANDQTCSRSKDQNLSSPAAAPEVKNSGDSISQSGSTGQEKTAEDLQVNPTKNDNCLVSEEGSAEMETSETKTKDELEITHRKEERRDSVLENKVKDKEFRHVSSASEMEGVNSESDIQYTESDIQTSDMDTIQVFVYQDASQTSASESVFESPVKSVSPTQCVKSDMVDKNDARTSESGRESPKSSSENIEVGKVPECRTETVPVGHTSAFKSVMASPKSVQLKSTKLNIENTSVGQGEAHSVQVTKDPAQSKLIPSLASISESVRECRETHKPVEQCPVTPSVTVGNASCEENGSQTDKGPEAVVDASVDSDISKKDNFDISSASQNLKEKISTLDLLKDETFPSDTKAEEIEMSKSGGKVCPRRKSSRHLSRNSAISDDYQLVEIASTPVANTCRTPKKTDKDNKKLESKDDSDIKKLESSSETDQVKIKSLDEGMSINVAKDIRKDSFNADNEEDDSKTTGERHTAVIPKTDENLWIGTTRRRMKNSGESETDNNSPRNDNQRRKMISKRSSVGISSGEHSAESEADGSDSVGGKAKSDGKNKKGKSKEVSEQACLSQENNDNIKESLPDLETKLNESQGCPKVMCDSKEKKDLSKDDLVLDDVDTTHEGEAEEDDLDSVDISLNSAPETRQKPKKRVTIKRQMSFDQDESKAGEYTTSEKKSKTDLKKKRKNLKKSSKHKEEDGISVQGSNESVDHDTSLKQTKELVIGEESCREGTSEISSLEEQDPDLDLDEDSDDSAKKKKVETQCSFGFSVNASTSETPQEGFSLLDSLNLIPELEEGEEEEIESKSVLSDLGSLDPDRAVSPEIISITQKSCFISISALIRDELRSTASTSSPLPPSPMNFFQITAPVSPLPSSPAPSRSQKVKKQKRKTKSKNQLDNLSTLVNDPHKLKTQTVTKGKLKNSGKPLETQSSESTDKISLEPKLSKKNLGSSGSTLRETKDSEVQLATEMPSILHLDEAISSMSGSQRRIARVAKKQTDLPNFGASPATTTFKPKPVYTRTTSGDVPSASTGTSSMSLVKQQLTKRQENQEAKELRSRKRKSSESEMLAVKKQVLTPPKTAGNSQSEVGEMLTQYLQDPQEDTVDKLVEKWLTEHEKTLLVTEIFRESVKVLQACRDDQRPLVERIRSVERGDDEEVVMMTGTEIRLLDLLTCLLLKREEESPRHQLMELLWNAIFLACTPCFGRLSLCRMFTALCRHEGDIEQVRVFVYKLLTCGYLSYVQPILNVVGVWPLSLTPGPDSSAMSLVVSHIVLNSCQSQSAPPDVKTLGPCFQEICGWFPLNETPSQLLSRVIEKLKLAVTADSAGAQFETMKSIELLLWSHGWRFIYMSFVNHHLTSVCDAWKAKGDNSNINPKYAITLIRIFGNIYQLPRFTQKHKEFSKALKRCFIPILDIPTKHTELQTSCAEVLAELSPLHPHFIMDVLSQWFKKHRSEVPASVRNKLEQTRHFIATKISPFNVDSFV